MFLVIVPSILLTFSCLFGYLTYVGAAPFSFYAVSVIFAAFAATSSGCELYAIWKSCQDKDAVNDGSNRRIE
jgi:hypothetical protein